MLCVLRGMLGVFRGMLCVLEVGILGVLRARGMLDVLRPQGYVRCTKGYVMCTQGYVMCTQEYVKCT